MAKFRQKIAEFFLGQEYIDSLKVVDKSIISSASGYENTLIDGFRSTDYKQEEFLKNIRGWTFANINAIAEAIGFIQLKLMKMGDDGEVEEEKDSNILDKLNRVNEYTTKFDHFWLTAAYLESVGEAPWFLDKEENGEIVGIYILDPSKLEPVPSKDNNRLVGDYRFSLDNGKSILIPSHQIIPLRYPDPANPVRGLGTMEAAARSIDIDNAAEKWNFQFFKNNATPGAKLKIPTKGLTEQQRTRLKNKIKEQYQGVEKSQQLWILFDDMDVEPFGTAPKDMDFRGQQEWMADKIRGMFRVPKPILAQTDGVNFASAKVAQNIFINNTIKPKLERIVQQLNEFYIVQFADSEKMYLDYVDPAEEDREVQLKTYDNALKNGWMTINEVRCKEGLENLGVVADIPYISSSLIPLGTSEEMKPEKGKSLKHYASRDRMQQVKARTKPVIDKEGLEKELVKCIKNKISGGIGKNNKNRKVMSVDKEEKPRVFSREEKEAFWLRKSVVYNKFLPKVRAKMIRIFDEQEDSILRKFGNKKEIKAKVPLLSQGKERDRVTAIVISTFESLMRESGDETFNFLGIGMKLNVKNDYIQKWIKSRIVKFADASTETTNQAIKTTLAEGIELGESLEQRSKRIAVVFDKARSYRSDRIARSETTRFNVEATEQAYVESGIVTGKEWIVNPGACPYCLAFAGKVVKLGDSFADVGDTIRGENVKSTVLDYEDIEHPPLHVNCRCDLIPVLGTRSVGNASSAEKDIIQMKKANRERNGSYNLDLEHKHKHLKEDMLNEINEKADEVKEETNKAFVNKIDSVLGNE